jgi:hypothetical protein
VKAGSAHRAFGCTALPWGRFWLDPKGRLHRVEEHEAGAAELLGRRYARSSFMDRFSCELQALGWVRVVADYEDVLVSAGEPGRAAKLSRLLKKSATQRSCGSS